MIIRITESQYRILVNKQRDVVFGNIYEAGKPKETPEEIDGKIKEILNHVRNQSKRNKYSDSNYQWLYNKIEYDKTEEKKFQKVLDQIKKIQEELEDKKIEGILNHVRNGGEFIRVYGKDKNYNWLYNRLKYDKPEEQKFKKAFDQIEEIQEELENKKIEEILNHVRNGGEFIRVYGQDDNYSWLKNKLNYNKPEKYKNVLNQISEIQAKLGIKREWWGEKTIKQVLEQMGFEDIPRQGQHIYKDCRNSLTCKFYKYDIYLPYNKNNYMVGKNKNIHIPESGIIFEYDGIQHFQSNEYFGGEEGFIKRIHSDKEKNSYCKNNNIKLVRISYTTNTYHEINHAVFYGLKSKNTNGNIITTGDYPQLGWNQQ